MRENSTHTFTWMTSRPSNHRSTVSCHTYHLAQQDKPVLPFSLRQSNTHTQKALNFSALLSTQVAPACLILMSTGTQGINGKQNSLSLNVIPIQLTSNCMCLCEKKKWEAAHVLLCEWANKSKCECHGVNEFVCVCSRFSVARALASFVFLFICLVTGLVRREA